MSGTVGKAGLWRRLGGFLIDGIVLGLIGFGAGSALFDTLARLPGPTRLIGLAVGLAYYGLLSSGSGGSRTIGMRAMDTKVVGVDGRPLSLPASFWRAFWLQAPFMLNGLLLTGLDQTWALIYGVLAGMLVFGVITANIVLVFGNGRTGRLVHDLLSGAIVVRTGTETLPAGEKRGAVILAVVAVIGMGAAVFGVSQKAKDAALPFGALTKTQAAVGRLPGVLDVGVTENTMTSLTDGETKRTLIVNARVTKWPEDGQALADQIGAAARQSYPLKPGQEIKVVLRRGYDIGIAQGWTSHSYSPRLAPV